MIVKMVKFLSMIFFLSICAYAQSGWEKQYIDAPSGVRLIFFVDSLKGFAGGSGFWKTTDGGNNWNLSIGPGFIRGLESIFFLDSLIGWGVGSFGIIEKTTDGGTTWKAQQLFVPGCPELPLLSIFFIDKNVGWASGYCFLEKTTDGGEHWTLLEGLPLITMESIWFSTPQRGIVVGYSRYILETTDGGQTWFTVILDDSQIHLSSVMFVDSLNGYACGWTNPAMGIILKTNDGGLQWTITKIPGTSSFRSLFFPTRDTGWVVGMAGFDGVIYHTTNGGLLWSEQYRSYNSDFYSVFFVNSTYGWVACHSFILHTKSGGITKVEKDNSMQGTANDITNNVFHCNRSSTVELPVYLLKPSTVFVKIYDILGRELFLTNKSLNIKGLNYLQVNVGNFRTGMYIYRIELESGIIVKRFLLLK
jgi:photosystem II stability/assembly factor-like uncharacterized protein